MPDLPEPDIAAATPATGTVQIAQLRLPCATASFGIGRVPAQPRPDRTVALLLPGVTALLASTCLRAIPLTRLFDVVVAELPGHGLSDPVAELSLAAFAREYAALIDRYLPGSARLVVIGESFGGLIGCALAHLRPERIAQLVLLETPFALARPPLAALLAAHWQRERLPYLRQIYRTFFGFDPQQPSLLQPIDWHAALLGLAVDCTVLAGSESFALDPPVAERPPSQQTDADLAALRALPNVSVLPRLTGAGHCLLLDDPWACVAALAQLRPA